MGKRWLVGAWIALCVLWIGAISAAMWYMARGDVPLLMGWNFIQAMLALLVNVVNIAIQFRR